MELIKYRNYSAYYKLKKDKYYIALKNLNFSINKGECLSVVGSSGCGKSTLIKSLLGSYEFTEGDIFYDGVNLDSVDISKQNIGYVHRITVCTLL